MATYLYNFPPIGLKTDKALQVEKIAEEAKEVETAENEHELIMETLDLIQACETLCECSMNKTLTRLKPKPLIRITNAVITEGLIKCVKSNLKNRLNVFLNQQVFTESVRQQTNDR